MAGIKGKSGGSRQGAGRPFVSAEFRDGPAEAEIDGAPVRAVIEVDPRTGDLIARFPGGVVVLRRQRRA